MMTTKKCQTIHLKILYLVRAYLETGRYEEALAAQLALEEKTGDPEDETPESGLIS